MTDAVRDVELWELRDWVARWLMRTMEGGRVLQIGLWGITAASTLATALASLGLVEYIAPALTGFGIAALVFVWVYDRTETMNQQNRAKMDRADNFAGPGMAMGLLLQGRQRAVMAESIVRGDDPTVIRERMDAETVALLAEFRDGIDIESVFDGDLPEQLRGVNGPTAPDGDPMRVSPRANGAHDPTRDSDHETEDQEAPY